MPFPFFCALLFIGMQVELLCATPALDLCYEVSWNLGRSGGPQRKLVRPVTAIPQLHPLLKSTCGAKKAGAVYSCNAHTQVTPYQRGDYGPPLVRPLTARISQEGRYFMDTTAPICTLQIQDTKF